jgi:hypothetical protein
VTKSFSHAITTTGLTKYYGDVLRGLSLPHPGVLAAASALMLGYAVWAFERRDLVR